MTHRTAVRSLGLTRSRFFRPILVELEPRLAPNDLFGTMRSFLSDGTDASSPASLTTEETASAPSDPPATMSTGPVSPPESIVSSETGACDAPTTPTIVLTAMASTHDVAPSIADDELAAIASSLLATAQAKPSHKTSTPPASSSATGGGTTAAAGSAVNSTAVGSTTTASGTEGSSAMVNSQALTAALSAKIVLHQNARIVFFGDSITANGSKPEGFITRIEQQLAGQYPSLSATLINEGMPGNAVPDLQARVGNVIALKPTLVVMYIGINDVWRTIDGMGTPTTPSQYTAGLNEIIGKLEAAGSQVLLCTPSVIGEKHDGENALDGLLDQYAGLSRQVAVNSGVSLCDLHAAFQKYEQQYNTADQAAGVLTYDGVHLTAKGNELVADEILSMLQVGK